MAEKKYTPRLYNDAFRSLDAATEAVHLLIKAKIPFLNLGPMVDLPSLEPVILEYGTYSVPVTYHGVDEIKKFIGKWKNKSLPKVSAF